MSRNLTITKTGKQTKHGIHYGLTFCLFMGTLYDASLGPTLFFQTYAIRQLDLMPKTWNELLRH